MNRIDMSGFPMERINNSFTTIAGTIERIITESMFP
jgi:hypothetical protein